MKGSAPATYPDAGGDYAEEPAAGYGGYAHEVNAGSAAYDGDDDMADTAAAMPTESAPERMMDVTVDGVSARERRVSRRGRRDRTANAELAAPPPPAAGSASPTATTADPATPQKAIEQQDPEIAARHIVYTAAMTISVFNLEDTMAKAEAIPETYGGYISQMNSGHLVLRIPSKHLRSAMEDFGKFGNVENRSLQAMDVTAQFTDVESRIRALEETHKQLLELLSKARTVSEALQVRQTLDSIATELEVLKGQMRQMQNQISYSTLTVGLYERGPHTPTPSSNDPFPWVNDLGVEATEWK